MKTSISPYYLIVWLMFFLFVLIVSFVQVELAFVALFVFTVFRAYHGLRAGQLAIGTNYIAIGIYCSLAAAFQISHEVTFWGASLPERDSYAHALIICVLYSVFFEIGYSFIGIKSVVNNKKGDVVRVLDKPILFGFIVVALLMISDGLMLSHPEMNMIERSFQDYFQNRAFSIFIFASLPKTFVWACLSLSISFFVNKKTLINAVFVVLCLIEVAIFGAPATTSRQIIIIGGMPVVYYMFSNRKPLYIGIVIWLGVVVVGPLLNYFSRDYMYGNITQSFPYSSDFDAMFVSAAIIERSEYFILGYGRYLLYAFSFFLPAEMKPFSSFDPLLGFGGAIFSQANVSLPPFVEGYLDFGIFGPIVLGGFVGGVMKVVDLKTKESTGVGVLLGYSILSSYIPFVRGPILGWGMFFMSGVISFGTMLLIYRMCSKGK